MARHVEHGIRSSCPGINAARGARLVIGIAATLAAAACSSSGGTAATNGRSDRATSPGAPTTAPQQGGGRFTDAVEVSVLRERALALLVEMATAGSPELRGNALEALSSVPRRLEPVVRAATADESPALRITSCVIIGNIQLESSSSFADPLLHDSVAPVRASAAYALKRCGRETDLTPIADLLADPSPRWRAHAAYLLGQLGDKSAIPMLEEAVRGSFPRASRSEVRLMELQIAEAKVRLGDEEAIQVIRAALFPARSEDLEATAVAAQLTGELSDRSSARELVMLTRMKDDSGNMMPPEVRLAAAGSLGAMRVGQAAPESVAMEYISDPSEMRRAQAAFVLGQCGKRQALETLEPMLADASPRVRLTAAAAIVRITG